MRSKSLLRQGMDIILIITLVIGALLGSTLYLSVRTARNNAFDIVHKAHTGTHERIVQTLDSIENTCFVMAYSSTVQSMLTDEESFALVNYRKAIRSTFAIAFASNQSIAGVTLYNADYSYIISSGDTLWDSDPLPERYQSLKKSQFDTVDNERKGGTDLLLIYPVYRTGYTDNIIRVIIGYLVVNMDSEFWKELMYQSNYVEGTLVMFTDQNGECIYSNRKSGENLNDVSGSGNVDSRFHIVSEIPQAGWQLHSIMSNIQLSNDMKPILLIMCVITCFLIVLIILMQRFFRKQIIAPLDELQQFMTDKTDARGRINLTKHLENEMRVVMGVLNDMLDKIEKSNEVILESETKMLQEETARQQMEIMAYRNQINPHFLYNTLDCIRGIAYMHQATEIVDISEALSRMFRYAVKGDNFVTMKDELEYIQNYAVIIGYRFDGRIRVQNHIDPEFSQYIVLRMLLQPLVENAVLHGLEEIIGDGSVDIYARKQDESLMIRIDDNGVGASEQKIQKLNEQIASMQHVQMNRPSEHDGIGLMNIARRLYLHYGEDASIRIFRGTGCGLSVEICLPVRTEGENVSGNPC